MCFLVPSVILIGLPIFGVTRFHKAWLVRRTTGGGMAKQVLIGVAAFVPAAVLLPLLGEDAGYWIFIAVAFTLIAGGALGIGEDAEREGLVAASTEGVELRLRILNEQVLHDVDAVGIDDHELVSLIGKAVEEAGHKCLSRNGGVDG